MPAKSDDPLRRVTLNLYEADCAYLEEHHGQGWTTFIRDHIHRKVQDYKTTIVTIRPRTLGDLPE